jgi:hypothetical protein
MALFLLNSMEAANAEKAEPIIIIFLDIILLKD